MAGYSGTPLAKKLGIREGDVVAVLEAPSGFLRLLDGLPPAVTFRPTARGRPDLIVSFHNSKKGFERRFPVLARAVRTDGGIWIAWPKRSSGATTDMTEDVIRDVALPTGLVDNKVCAIDEKWSGLRLVWRREMR